MSDFTAAPRLSHYVRYRDLHNAGIVNSWEQLSNLIDDYGFPPGTLLSPNCRAWDIDDVQRWLKNRPTARKAAPTRKREPEAA